MILSDETGLPEVPEGYFWEVAQVRHRSYRAAWGSCIMYPLAVSICRHEKTWLGKKRTVRVSSSTMVSGGRYRDLVEDASHENILNHANRALSSFNKTQRMLSTIGVYPPDNLKETE